MAHRMAFLCGSVDEAARALAEYAQGRRAEGLLSGERNREIVDFWDAALLEPLYAQRAWRKLARLWVDGVEIDWRRRYDDPSPHRVPLPSYPFERTRYWLPDKR